MSESPTLRVGIVGCGNISTIYAKNAQWLPNIETVACADVDVAKARALAEAHSIPLALEPDDLFSHPDVDLVLNLTIPAAHAEVALKALRKGKHVYNEKPLSMRRRDAREILGLARERGLLIGCAPDTFLGAGYQTCRKLIADGMIGRPLAASAHMLSRGPEGWHPNPDFFYKKGGGPLFDMGPYYLTALVYLLGPVERVSGSARIGIPQRTISSQPRAGETIDVEIPTHISAVLDFAEGPVATLTTSFEVTAHKLPQLEIYGEEGSLSAPDPNTFGGPVFLSTRAEREWREVPLEFPHSENCRGLGLSDLARAKQGSPHSTSGTLAYHVLDIMHSILDSAEASRHIEVRSGKPLTSA